MFGNLSQRSKLSSTLGPQYRSQVNFLRATFMKQKTFFTADIWTCHGRKSTGVVNDTTMAVFELSVSGSNRRALGPGQFLLPVLLSECRM